MRFEPKSEAEIDAERADFQPLPAGTYDFVVLEADNAISKAGNDMIALTLTVYDAGGKTRKVRDWLLEAMPGKLKHAAYSCGLARQYDAGTLDASDFQGRPGQVILKIEPAKGNFDAKNAVKDYAVSPGEVAARKPREMAGALADLDDAVPF